MENADTPQETTAENPVSQVENQAAEETQANVKEKAAEMKEKATDKVREVAASGKDKAVAAAGTLSGTINDAAKSIDENFGAQYGDYARSAASKIDEFAEKVNAKDVNEIADDARAFVRKRPAIAIGAAAAIGFALVRLFKSGRDDA